MTSHFMPEKKDFEKIYLKFYPVLLVYGKSITPNEQLIEDTIPGVISGFVAKKSRPDFKTSLANYLLVAFRNNLIRNIKVSPVKELTQEVVAEPEPEFLFEKGEKLEALLKKLPSHQREVIFLRYYKNKSYQEIAEILGINYQVARNFSYRAIKFLKKHMAKLSSLMLPFAF